jgi:hypothetical protein
MTESNHMIFRMAYRMAMADGEISANEALILHLFSSNMGLSADELKELKDSAEAIVYDELPELFPSRKDQIQLFEAACLMAMVDGKSDLEEWNLVMKLCEVFGSTSSPRSTTCCPRSWPTWRPRRAPKQGRATRAESDPAALRFRKPNQKGRDQTESSVLSRNDRLYRGSSRLQSRFSFLRPRKMNRAGLYRLPKTMIGPSRFGLARRTPVGVLSVPGFGAA